jgi:predicted SnoaL-like aldol condensation-catalyzing enzyme
VSDRRAFFEGFVDLMYRQRDVRAAFDTYVAEDCVQHDPSLPDGPAAAVVDLHRADGDRVVEHWDVLQPWPATAANDHPMF